MLVVVFVVLLVMMYLIFLMPKHMTYNKLEEIKQSLVSQKNSIFIQLKSGEYEKIPKQNLFPKNIQNLQSDLVSVLTKSGFDQYEIKLEGAEVVSKQCCFKFSLNAKTRFKHILKLFRNLRKDPFLLQDFEINNASENALDFRAVLLGFCGEFCVCESPV